MVKDACRQAGIKRHITPRILRHTFATYAADRHGISITRALLGHANRSQRQLILNDNILKDLKAYRKRVLSGPEHPVFCSLGVKQKPGTQMSTKELSELCKNTAINAGITSKVTTLTLRHTFATHMYQAGVAVRDIQEMMGHATITETTVYLHVTTEAAKRVLNDHAYHIMHWEEEK
jgi:site-specific recombinase XerD